MRFWTRDLRIGYFISKKVLIHLIHLISNKMSKTKIKKAKTAFNGVGGFASDLLLGELEI